MRKEQQEGINMKRIYMFLCVLFAMNALVADMARIEALVVDEITGEPLRGVEVTGNFSMNHGLLAVKGSPGPNICKRLTDVSGRCKLSGETNLGEAGCYVRHAPRGYYGNSCGGGYTFKHKNFFGVWQPDNLVVTFRVQRIVHPVPLFVKQVGMMFSTGNAKDIFPPGSDTLRFDMMKGEYLPPVGNGVVADIEFTRLPRQDFGEGVNGGGVKGMSYRDSMRVRFLGGGNGLIEMHPPEGAALKIRTAPESGYVQDYLCWRGRDKALRREGHYDKRRCFCFRIRARRNDKGEIVEAYYGKIYGDITFNGGHTLAGSHVPVSSVNMRYYLNPASLDRNLEWNRANLCPDPGKINEPEL